MDQFEQEQNWTEVDEFWRDMMSYRKFRLTVLLVKIPLPPKLKSASSACFLILQMLLVPISWLFTIFCCSARILRLSSTVSSHTNLNTFKCWRPLKLRHQSRVSASSVKLFKLESKKTTLQMLVKPLNFLKFCCNKQRVILQDGSIFVYKTKGTSLF